METLVEIITELRSKVKELKLITEKQKLEIESKNDNMLFWYNKFQELEKSLKKTEE